MQEITGQTRIYARWESGEDKAQEGKVQTKGTVMELLLIVAVVVFWGAFFGASVTNEISHAKGTAQFSEAVPRWME